MKQAYRNLIRHYKKSILSVFIGVVTVLLLLIYAGNMDSAKRQLASLPEAMEVIGRVSNLNGSRDEGISISEERVEGIVSCPEVENAVFSVQFMTGFGAFTLEEYKGNLNYFASAVNAIAGVPGLKSEEISYGEGWNESLFATGEPLCILDARTMEQQGLRFGDEVAITLYYYQYGQGGIGIGKATPLVEGKTFTIAGAMDYKDYTGSVTPPQMLFPFESVRQIFHEEGIEFTADSASFQVKDPFRLNGCKSYMKELGFLSVIRDADFSYAGNALTMRDEEFINAAENLRETIAFFTGMLPFVVAILLFVGYLSSYLLIQSRREEYVVMRLVGMSRGHCFYVLLFENVMIEAAACVLVSLPAMLTGMVSGRALLLADAVFLLAFLLGSAAALWSFHRLSVMEVLSAGE